MHVFFSSDSRLPLAISIQHLSPIRVIAIAMRDHTGGCLNKEPILQIIQERVQTDLGEAMKGNVFSSGALFRHSGRNRGLPMRRPRGQGPHLAKRWEPRGFSRVAAGYSSYDGDLSLPLGLALGSPIFPSGCEGKLGVALESLQGLRV